MNCTLRGGAVEDSVAVQENGNTLSEVVESSPVFSKRIVDDLIASINGVLATPETIVRRGDEVELYVNHGLRG